jgi:hypothetical protein
VARNEPVLITDADEDPEKELRRREIRYVAMMLFRVGCLIASAFIVVQKPPLWQLWATLLVVGAVLLPWLAVLLANDRPPKRRHHAPSPGSGASQPAIEQREYKVIDHD